MKTEISKINEEVIKKTVDILKKGGICVYPTETCYGLGCDAINKNAIFLLILVFPPYYLVKIICPYNNNIFIFIFNTQWLHKKRKKKLYKCIYYYK